MISESPPYQKVVQRLKSDPSALFLDLGCCVGQELRQLAFDGVPTKQLLGADIEPSFFDLGHELFNDRDSFQGQLFRADVLDEEDEELKRWNSKIDFIFVGAFLHLFPLEIQLQVLVRMMKLLKDKKGAMILGRQVGNRTPTAAVRKSRPDPFFQHNVESLRDMWDEAGMLTGTKWSVDGKLLDWVTWQKGKNLGLCGAEFNGETVDLRFWAERIE